MFFRESFSDLYDTRRDSEGQAAVFLNDVTPKAFISFFPSRSTTSLTGTGIRFEEEPGGL